MNHHRKLIMVVMLSKHNLLERLAPTTADSVLSLRAAGALEPDGHVRHPDHMAAELLAHPAAGRLAHRLGLRRAIVELMEWVGPGAYYYELARGKHVSQVLEEELHHGVEQLVILGAGYDTLAYRFLEELSDVAVFELDHPATAVKKRKRLLTAFGHLPSHVTYVAADFNSDPLDARLGLAGYVPSRRTLFLLSGVSYFLSDRGMDNMLSLIAASAPGNTLVFDYCYQDVIDGQFIRYGSRRAATRAASLGEPYRFGIYEGCLASAVGEHELSVVADLGPAELARRYLVRADGTQHGRLYGFFAIAHVRSTPQ